MTEQIIKLSIGIILCSTLFYFILFYDNDDEGDNMNVN